MDGGGEKSDTLACTYIRDETSHLCPWMAVVVFHLKSRPLLQALAFYYFQVGNTVVFELYIMVSGSAPRRFSSCC